MLSPGIRAHAQRRARLEAYFGGRARPGKLSLKVTSTPPRHQASTHSQERRCIFHHDGKRRQSARGYEIAGADAVGPFFGPRVDDRRIVRAGGGRGTLQKRSPALVRLDEREPEVRQRHGERKPREPRAGPYVGGRPGAHHLGKLERDQRVCEVLVDSVPGSADRARCVFVTTQHLDQREEAGGGAGGKLVSANEAFDGAEHTISGPRGHASDRARTRAMYPE